MESKGTSTRVVQSPGQGSFAVIEWIESTEHPGLLCALTTGYGVYSLAIDPERILVQEHKPIGTILAPFVRFLQTNSQYTLVSSFCDSFAYQPTGFIKQEGARPGLRNNSPSKC